MKHITAPLVPGMYYHIYNRGNNREDLFIEKRNYPYFLSLYKKHIEPIADTYAYCLLRNHFHTSLRIKTEEEYLQQLRRPVRSLTRRKNSTPHKPSPTSSTPMPKPSTKGTGEREACLKNDLDEFLY
jgi:REP element-mobilizing transposase RayT